MHKVESCTPHGIFHFSLFTFGFAEDAHARHSSNKFDSALAQPHLSLFTFHFHRIYPFSLPHNACMSFSFL